MGGSVFTEKEIVELNVIGGLNTPRMPKDVYQYSLARIEKLLKPHFTTVGYPLEAPEKNDYGDIDISVSEPINEDLVTTNVTCTGDVLKTIIGAAQWKHTKGSTIYHFAIRWPDEAEIQTMVGREDVDVDLAPAGPQSDKPFIHQSDQKEASYKGRYIQIDINLCESSASLAWNLFINAHGGIWEILGGIIRPYGLTCTDKGLFMRIAEIESKDKKKSRVFVTDNSDDVLSYLGLDVHRYHRPFTSKTQLMEYAASCHFHRPDKKLELNGSDKQRIGKRTLYTTWVEVYLPTRSDGVPGSKCSLSRVEVIDDCKAFFGPEFASRFDEQKAKYVREVQEQALWQGIRKLSSHWSPEKKEDKTYMIKGMKREIAGEDLEWGSEQEKEYRGVCLMRKAYKEGRFDAVLGWAMLNVQAVTERQRAFTKHKSAQHFAGHKRQEKDNEAAVESS
ncbi:hypothetical protein RBB50_010833 [Rhinocladiella similis]